MKALLIKDFNLMKLQKNFFLIILLVAIGMSFYCEDPSFIIGYLTFICSFFTISTISYDEYDNGYAFLFTLPISRKTYVLEKYCFGVLSGSISFIVSTLLCIFISLIRGMNSISDLFQIACFIFIFLLLMLAITLPIQIKYGSEKGRIALIVSMGILFLFGLFIIKLLSYININWVNLLNELSYLNISIISCICLIISLLLLYLSYRISISFMYKKEF